MKRYKAYFSISKNTEHWAFLNFINHSGLDIQTKISSSFLPEEAVSADIIFVDEKTASRLCVALSDIKREKSYFLPVLLLASGKANTGKSLPACIDDIIFKSFSPTEWKRRIATFLTIREKEMAGSGSEEDDFRTLFAESHSMMFLIDPETGRIVDVNPAACRFYGYTNREMTSMKIQQINVLNEEQMNRELANAGNGKKNYFVFEHRLADGSIKTVEVYSGKAHHKGRTLLYSVIHNITEAKKTEKLLRESRQLFETLAKISPTGIFKTDAKGKTTYVNPRWSEITGVSYERSTKKGWADILPPNEREELLARWTNNMASKTFSKEKLRIVRSDGTIRWVLGHAIPEIRNGKFTGYVGAITDITDLVKAEQALRESENKYRSLSETSMDIILTYDLQGIITYVNPVIKPSFGYSPEEVIGKSFSNFLVPEYLDIALSNFRRGKSGHFISLYELEIFHKNGRKVPAEINPTSLHDDNGNVIGRLTVIRNITSRKKTERELLIRDKALNAAANVVIITDANSIIEWVNQAFTKLTGYSKVESIGKSASDLIDSGKQDIKFRKKLYETLLTGKPWKGEIIDKRKDGTLYPVEEIISPVTNENGKVEHLIGIMTDISERKAAERELHAAKDAAEEANRLKSAFLANMNHEIRTPMNAIMGFSELMLEATPEEKENYAKIVNNSAGQLLNLIDDIIYLSRLQSEKLPVKKTLFYPAEVVREVFNMFDLPEIKKDLDMKLEIPDNIEKITLHADINKVKQVLTNFVSNALKYTPEGYVKIGFEIQDKLITFFVEDSGIGVPKEEQQKIFDAFYRGTKAVNSAIRGTGLGLNIAKELVKLMNSTIGVRSLPGKGSKFFFSLPTKTGKIVSVKETPFHDISKKRWKDLNILIAEDDDTNFLYLEVILKDLVKNIDRANDGKQALEMTQKYHYNIILMDLKMPVMNGFEATSKIKKRQPQIPVIATTAYATQEEKDLALKAGCDNYLKKPIKKADIIALIDKYISITER